MAVTMTAVQNGELFTRDPAHAVVGSAASRRYKYVRPGRWSIVHVIVDVDANGHEDWTEQAPVEVRWYPFTPSDAERQMLCQWLSRHPLPTRGPLSPCAASQG
jgi:hypothetical protein